MSTLKVGVIGVGQMGTYHAQIYRKLPQTDLVALCEYNDTRRAQLEEEFPGVKTYKDYKEILKAGEIKPLKG